MALAGVGKRLDVGDEDRVELAFIETYNQTAKPFKWTYTGKVLEA